MFWINFISHRAVKHWHGTLLIIQDFLCVYQTRKWRCADTAVWIYSFVVECLQIFYSFESIEWVVHWTVSKRSVCSLGVLRCSLVIGGRKWKWLLMCVDSRCLAQHAVFSQASCSDATCFIGLCFVAHPHTRIAPHVFPLWHWGGYL